MLMPRSRTFLRWLLCGVVLSLALGHLSAAFGAESSTAAGEEFFEKQIRPLLATHCLQCHGGVQAEPRPRSKGD